MIDDRVDEEPTLPRSTVDKMILENVEKGILVTKEVKEIIMNCCVEFIHLVTTESNEICETEKKKTIYHEHIYKALKNLGYGDYIESCEVAHQEYASLSKMKPSRINKLKDSGLTMDELHIEQMKLFESARKAYDAMENGNKDCVDSKVLNSEKNENIEENGDYERNDGNLKGIKDLDNRNKCFNNGYCNENGEDNKQENINENNEILKLNSENLYKEDKLIIDDDYKNLNKKSKGKIDEYSAKKIKIEEGSDKKYDKNIIKFEEI